jgi:hypothetical protein
MALTRSTDNFPLGTPAQWIAEGHVTCNIQCSARTWSRRMVDVRLETLPQDLPWSMMARRLVCKECGHSRFCEHRAELARPVSQRHPFTKHWKG